MIIKIFVVNPLQENCYVVFDSKSRDAAIIDPGMFFDEERKEIADYIRFENLTIKYVLLTHGHFDHVASCKWIEDRYGINPHVHKLDLELQQNARGQLFHYLGLSLEELDASQPKISIPLNNQDTINLGHHSFEVIHTPGHTAGSVCYYCKTQHLLFSGDTLFKGSYGRTDLDNGNESDMHASINRLLSILPSNVDVLPGHGSSTTIGFEQRYNPLFDSDI